jgi:hypothetical protein
LNSASACFESEDHFKVIGGGTAGASHENGGRSIGANATRFVLALGLLVGLCASAHAATVRHSKPRHVIVRHSQGATPRFVVPPARYDDTPSYDDPSKFGGA